MKTKCLPIPPLAALVAALALIAAPNLAHAQNGSLTTTFGGVNSADGFMFDVIAARPLQITGVQFAFASLPLTDTFEVYGKSGTHVGSELVAANWTLAGAGSITTSALNVPTPILLLSSPITIPGGTGAAIYVRRVDVSEAIRYSNGVGTGTVQAADPNLFILEGKGINGLFGSTDVYGNRIPNVTIHYTLADVTAPSVSVIGANRIRTTEQRVRIDGIASDDVGVASVKVRFKRQRNNGTTRNVTRFLPFDPATGLFRINVRTFVGRNPVRFNVTDTAGKGSGVARAVIIRKE